MTDANERKLTPEHIREIENVLSKGDRVEIIPQKDGVKLIHIRRQEIRV